MLIKLFRFIKSIFVTLFTSGRRLTLRNVECKYTSLGNQPCITVPALIVLNTDELRYYPLKWL